MFFHHRKFLNDSQVLEDSIISLCEPFCDPLGNSDGYCPIPCIPRCYPLCNNPIIYDAPPPPSDDHQSRSFKLSIFFIVSLAVLATIFLIFALYTAYRFYKVRNRGRRTRTQLPPPQNQDSVPIVHEFFVDQGIGPLVHHPIWYIRTIGLPASVISEITTFKYKKNDGLVEGTECSVCLNEFQENESLRLLPKCQHAFHVNCIDTWLRSHTNCPLCRAPISATSQPQPLARQQNLGTSDQVLESQIPENEAEIPRSSVRVDDNDGNETQGGNGLRGRDDDVGSSVYGVQQLRRSVSMDSLAASALSDAIADAVSMRGDRSLGNRMVQMGDASNNPEGVDDDPDQKKVMNNSVCVSSTDTLSMPKGASALVKRSLSCSAKVFLSRYSRGRSSTSPPQ